MADTLCCFSGWWTWRATASDIRSSLAKSLCSGKEMGVRNKAVPPLGHVWAVGNPAVSPWRISFLVLHLSNTDCLPLCICAQPSLCQQEAYMIQLLNSQELLVGTVSVEIEQSWPHSCEKKSFSQCLRKTVTSQDIRNVLRSWWCFARWILVKG